MAREPQPLGRPSTSGAPPPWPGPRSAARLGPVALVLLGATASGAEGWAAEVGTATAAEDHRALEERLFGAPGPEPEGDPPNRRELDRRALEERLFGGPEAGAEDRTTTGAEDRRALEERLFAPEPEASREADVAGGPGEGRVEGPTASAGPSRLLDSLQDALDERSDRLAIGGNLFLRLEYRASRQGRFDEQTLVSPSTMDLYLDARPVDRVRTYARARLAYDFTAPATAEEPAPVGDGAPTLGEQFTRQQTEVFLDQLWVKFDAAQRVFFTVGKQRVRWGTGRIWNPTDALNEQRFNPFALFDPRLGVGLVKVHVPFEDLGANVYAMALLDGADRLDRVGGAMRAEIPLSRAELAVSATYRRDTPWRLGFDASAGVGDFELRAEVAGLYDLRDPFFAGRWSVDAPLELADLEVAYRDDELVVQAVLGFDYTLTYGDDEQAIVGLEYFFNDAGYGGSDLYPLLLLAPALGDIQAPGVDLGFRAPPRSLFQPLYLGRHYLAALAVLPTPFGLEDHSVTLTAIANLSDQTGVARVDHSVRLLPFLTLRSYVNVYLGSAGGEFVPGLSVPALPGLLPEGISTAAPLVDLGLALSTRL